MRGRAAATSPLPKLGRSVGPVGLIPNGTLWKRASPSTDPQHWAGARLTPLSPEAAVAAGVRAGVRAAPASEHEVWRRALAGVLRTPLVLRSLGYSHARALVGRLGFCLFCLWVWFFFKYQSDNNKWNIEKEVSDGRHRLSQKLQWKTSSSLIDATLLLTAQYSHGVPRHAAEQAQHPWAARLAAWSSAGRVGVGSFALCSFNTFKWKVPRGSRHSATTLRHSLTHLAMLM